MSSVGKAAAKPFDHAMGSTQHVFTERGIGLVQPTGQAHAAGQGVQLADAHARFGEHEVGANHRGERVSPTCLLA